MSGPDSPTAVIRTRDLDTDDEQRVEVPVAAVDSPAERRTALTDAVRARHPAARSKSYTPNIASFVDPDYLIIARYIPVETGIDRTPVTPQRSAGGEQTVLFED